MLVYLTLLNTDEEKEKFSTLYDTYYKQLLYVARSPEKADFSSNTNVEGISHYRNPPHIIK